MRPRRDMPQDGVRRNEMIRAREVRVIGADGEQLGILQRNEAVALAKEAGMDGGSRFHLRTACLPHHGLRQVPL